jgi:hypothetical protein
VLLGERHALMLPHVVLLQPLLASPDRHPECPTTPAASANVLKVPFASSTLGSFSCGLR